MVTAFEIGCVGSGGGWQRQWRRRGSGACPRCTPGSLTAGWRQGSERGRLGGAGRGSAASCESHRVAKSRGSGRGLSKSSAKQH